MAQEARAKAGELSVLGVAAGNAGVYAALFPLTERPYYLDRPVDEAGWALFWAGYYDLLRTFPAEALRKGVIAWEMSGGKRAFPTPSELYPHVNAAAEPIRRAIYRAEKLATMPVADAPRPEQSQEERDAIAAGLRDTLAQLGAKKVPDAPVRRPMSAPISPSVQADLERRAAENRQRREQDES